MLADDMGLGKTLEVIALICTNRPGVGELAYFHPPADPDQASGSGAGGSQQAAAAAAGEQAAEAEEGRPKKRQRKGKEKVGEAPAAAGAAPATGGKGGKKLGALEQEAADRAAAAEGAPTLPAADGPCGTLIVCPLRCIGVCLAGGAAWWGVGWPKQRVLGMPASQPAATSPQHAFFAALLQRDEQLGVPAAGAHAGQPVR